MNCYKLIPALSNIPCRQGSTLHLSTSVGFAISPHRLLSTRVLSDIQNTFLFVIPPPHVNEHWTANKNKHIQISTPASPHVAISFKYPPSIYNVSLCQAIKCIWSKNRKIIYWHTKLVTGILVHIIININKLLRKYNCKSITFDLLF